MIIHTIRYGNPPWMEPCVLSLEAWCERHGYEVFEWRPTACIDPYPCPKYLELEAIYMMALGCEEKMLFIDADVYVHPDAPEFPEHLEGMLMATDTHHERHAPYWREFCQQHRGEAATEGHPYCNAGVFYFGDNDSMMAFIKHAKPPYHADRGFMDQHDMNHWAWRAKEDGMKFDLLPSEWNRWGRDRQEEPTWFWHMWGDDKMGDLEKLRREQLV